MKYINSSANHGILGRIENLTPFDLLDIKKIIYNTFFATLQWPISFAILEAVEFKPLLTPPGRLGHLL